jgi:four helix bundle protein
MMREVKNHKDLRIWRLSRQLVSDIYGHTARFPKDELYALTNQMRRAAISVGSNIAEGAARSTTKEYIWFLYVSTGSLSELETQVVLSKDLGYLNGSEAQQIMDSLVSLRKQILSTIKSLKASNPSSVGRDESIGN